MKRNLEILSSLELFKELKLLIGCRKPVEIKTPDGKQEHRQRATREQGDGAWGEGGKISWGSTGRLHGSRKSHSVDAGLK